MRYLLVGNGPSQDVAVKAKHADQIIQINTCHHIQSIPLGKTSYVAVSSTGSKTAQQITTALLDKQDLLPSVRILLARNLRFYKLKGYVSKVCNTWTACEFGQIEFKLPWQVEAVSLAATLQLELRMISLGMPPSCMPSTGMIAYHWLRQRLNPGDSLDIAGFTFEGWEGHPWQIEKTLVKGIYPPGYRGDPSYEKHRLYG